MLLGIPALIASRHAEKVRLANIYVEIEDTLHKTNDLIFLHERKEGRVTNELWMDYIQVMVTIRRLHVIDPASFSLPKLILEIPKNKWLPIFIEKIEEIVEG